MKKNFIIPAVLLGAALTVACNKQESGLVIEQGEENFRAPFTLEASLGATKTETEDGTKYTWSEGDALNVFYAKTGESVYSKNVCFNYTTEGNVFEAEGDVDLAEGEAYDWYVLYPYSNYITAPTGEDYISIGAKSSSAEQVQKGNNDKSHLAGQNFPLYGKVENVSADATPSTTLQQALSVVKVHVINKAKDPLAVTSIVFTAPEDIVGNYYINFSSGTPVFKAQTYVSKSAALRVEGGEAIENGASADFYIGIKPFKASMGSQITIRVNNDCEKTLELPQEAIFASGKIKTVNFEYEESSETPIYFNDFDKTVVSSDTNLTANTDVYKNEKGTGADNVTYSFEGTNSIRNTVPSSSAGFSGGNNIFFGKDNGHVFTIGNIELSSEKLQLSFAGCNVTTANFKVSLSEDGAAWSDDIQYTLGEATNNWALATADFTLPVDTKTLYIRFKTDVASSIRLDDVKLVEGNGGQEISFTSTAPEEPEEPEEPEIENSWSYTAQFADFGTNGYNINLKTDLLLNERNWTASAGKIGGDNASNGYYFTTDTNATNNRGVQIGTSKAYFTYTLSSSSFTEKIQEIEVESTNADVTVQVGGMTANKSGNTFSLSNPTSGDIVITLGEMSGKAIYLKSITIKFSE